MPGNILVTPAQEKQRFSINELSGAFNFSAGTIRKMISTTPPTGKRKSINVWHISSVAKMLDVRAPYVEQKPDAEPLITDPDLMPPKMKLTYYQAEDTKNASQLKARKNEIESRQVIPAYEVEQVVSQAFKVIALLLDTLPDALERDGMVSSADVELLIPMLDSAREQLTADLSKLAPNVQDINDNGDY